MIRFPSSHCSEPTRRPSPQRDTQTVFNVRFPRVQLNPGSNVHVLVHPSFPIVFPSSHSLFATIPSPHTAKQVSSPVKGLLSHLNPMLRRQLTHPSAPPLSHSSPLKPPGSLFESPHTVQKVSALQPRLRAPFVQLSPLFGSFRQVSLHPSPFTRLPSSHCSGPNRRPSPQPTAQTSALLPLPPVH